MRESTFERNQYTISPHVKTTPGRVKFKNLTPAHMREFYREKLDARLASATIHKMRVVLHKALGQAVAEDMIPRNVTDALKIPRIDCEEINPLIRAEGNRLIEAARSDRLEILYLPAIHAELRQGELLALKWEDLDLEGGTLRVRRTLTYAGTSTHWQSPRPRRAEVHHTPHH